MNISNLGICFGPTLMRSPTESIASIMNLKFCNIVVEILIEYYEKVSLLTMRRLLYFIILYTRM